MSVNRCGNVIGFMEIELDIDTGKYEIVDYASVADCGTVVHPKNFENAMRGGAVWGRIIRSREACL